MRISSAKDLNVYKKAYALSMEIFKLSRSWPAAEKYSLTDQIRRSSRSVCANLREAWAKRRYEAHFISKLTDCDGESCGANAWQNAERSNFVFAKGLTFGEQRAGDLGRRSVIGDRRSGLLVN